MNPTPADNALARAKDEIRADAEQVRRRVGELEFVTHRPPAGQAGEVPSRRASYSVGELCQPGYTSFLAQAYEAVLRRKPDSTSFDFHLRRLISGRSKIEILGDLRWSREGRDVGVRIPRLLPRYLLAKLMATPVLGYPVDWFVSLCSLPRMARHQRAIDVYNDARHQELGKQNESIARQIAEAHAELARLRSQGSEWAERLERLESDVTSAGAEAIELRHLTLSMNHWFSSLRKNLSELEQAAAGQARKSGAFHADVARRVLESDPQRPARLDNWSGRLADRLPGDARVVDLCSGSDWLACLRARGLDAVGVDAVGAIAERTDEPGRAIVVDEPAAVLTRAADQSLHGLTALDTAGLLRRMPADALLEQAHRVLRPQGWVLFGFRSEPPTIADRLSGRPESRIDGDLMANALQVAGFEDVEQVQTADGAACVLARAGNRP